MSVSSHTKLKRFRVKRIFICDVEAERPFAALEMVRADPDRYDTDIIESADVIDEAVSDEKQVAP